MKTNNNENVTPPNRAMKPYQSVRNHDKQSYKATTNQNTTSQCFSALTNRLSGLIM